MFKKIVNYTAIFVGLFVFAGIAYASSDISNLPVNLAVANISNILYAVAFIGGMLMILSPCSAATLPAYFATAFGVSERKKDKLLITKRTASFFLGFSLVYAFIGAGASFIGRLLNIYQEQLSIFAGILLIVFSLMMLLGQSFGSMKWKGLGRDLGYGRIFLYGMLFAVGFSGCAGPILAGILTIAVSLPAYQAILLMLFYSLGMGIPLVLLSLFFDKIKIFNTKFFKWNKTIRIYNREFFITLPNILSSILLGVIGVVFIVYRSTFVLSAKFPRALTEAGYAVQDKLLKMNLPTYIDAILFVVFGFIVIKLIEKYSDNILSFIQSLSENLHRVKWVLVIWIIISFAFNQFLFFGIKSDIDRQIALAEEAQRPADFDITVITDKNCPQCYDINIILNSFKQRNVNILSEKTVDISDKEAESLINKYKIEKIPTFIVKGEVEKDKQLNKIMRDVGIVEGDSFVFTNVPAPYKDLIANKVIGEFELVYITDNSCETCYDVTVHRDILKRLGLKPTNETTYDVSDKDGRSLINKYQIKNVPTVFLRGDLKAYSGFDNIWNQVGDIDEDGTYVFRRTEFMGTYKNLDSGEIVEAKQPQSAQDKSSSPILDTSNVINIDASEFSFSQSSIKVKKGERVVIRFTNKGKAPHDFVIDELGVKSSLLSSGKSEDVEFIPQKTGKFKFYCSVPGHREAGMEGIIEIVD